MCLANLVVTDTVSRILVRTLITVPVMKREIMDTEFNEEEIAQNIKRMMEEKVATDSEYNRVKEELSEIERQFNDLSAQRRRLENERNRIDQDLREEQKKAATAARLKLVEEQQAELREKFRKKAEELDSITASAVWREFAFEHQIDGGKKLAIALKGILADKRGLGKTLTSLIFCDMVKARKILVVAPNDVVSEFQKEIQHWSKRTVVPLSGMAPLQRSLIYPMLRNLEECICTINYEAWRKDKTIIDDLVKVGFDTILCDEAHRAKSWDKITARGIFQVEYRPNYCPECKKIDNYCGPWMGKDGKLQDKFAGTEWFAPICEEHNCYLETTVKHVLPMTGTPFMNKPQELFSLLYMVDRVKWPNERQFLQDYCMKGNKPGKYVFRPGGLERLTKSMGEFWLQRTREDAGITVPPPAIIVHEIAKDAIKYHKQYEAERTITEAGCMLLEDGTRKDIFILLELILRERQCMVWPAGIRITDPDTKELICNFDVKQSQKLDEATSLLLELLEEGERVVVFSQFVEPLREVYGRVIEAGYRGAMATGQEGKWQRDRVKEDFDLKTAHPTDYKYDVCFSTYKALGTGTNLNAARQVILLDDEWNAAGEDQAIGRIDRLNSVDQATAHIFRVKDSIDDWMAALVEDKRQQSEAFEGSANVASSTLDKMRDFFLKGKKDDE